jgi:DNA repair photolyase
MIAANTTYFKGRGAQFNPTNVYVKQQYTQDFPELIDEPLLQSIKTQVYFAEARNVVNKIKSPDLPFDYSINPYQGCEHGCVYCYARNTHEYWGYSAGIEFEQKIIVKQNCIEQLEKKFNSKNWEVKPIMLSGNTDCYQPLERKHELTRSILSLCLKYKHPVSIITKNALILRDLDILKNLAKYNLVHVAISITGLDEEIRWKMEPRSSTYSRRFETIQKLSAECIPVSVMMAPIIPGINNHEIPEVIELAAKAGARDAGYSMVRLNGSVGPIFIDWLKQNFPDRATKVWNQICSTHGGNVNDSRFGVRMRGQGNLAESIQQLFILSKTRFMRGVKKFEFDLTLFNHKPGDSQLSLF